MKFKNINIPELMVQTGEVFTFADIDRSIYFNPINPSKCLNKNKNIKVENDIDRAYCESYDKDETIKFWGYKTLPIDFINPLTGQEEIYHPKFNIIQQEGREKLKDILFETSTYNFEQFNLLTDDELKTLSLTQYNEYKSQLLISNIYLEAYKATNKYAKENGMEFLLFQNNGFIKISDIDSKKIN